MKKILFLLIIALTITNISYAQTEPSSQATNLQFLGIKAYGMSIKFDQASGAVRYLVLRSNSDITDVPVDGETYLIGERIGNTKVVGVGSFQSSYTVRESVANTTYYFAVFTYSVSGTNTNYKTDNPLKDSKATKGKNLDGYYDNYRIDLANAIEKMTELLYNHTPLLYGDYDDKVVRNILEKDTVIANESRKYVVCEYSNIIHDYEDDIDFNDYNREHVTAKSWMPSDPANNATKETSDYFNLFLVKANVNQNLRSSYVFDEVVNTNATEGDCKNGNNIAGLISFEPKESIKGNVARTLFYQLITYDGKGGSWAFDDLQNFGSDQDVDLLLQWHLQDPVDDFEIARNEYIYKEQGNRNPFVDFPDWVNCIDFETLTLNGNCPLDTADIDDAIVEINSNKILVYPNPIKDNGFIKLDDNEKITKIEFLGVDGRLFSMNYTIHNNIADINAKNLTKGIYYVKIYTEKLVYTEIIDVR